MQALPVGQLVPVQLAVLLVGQLVPVAELLVLVLV